MARYGQNTPHKIRPTSLLSLIGSLLIRLEARSDVMNLSGRGYLAQPVAFNAWAAISGPQKRKPAECRTSDFEKLASHPSSPQLVTVHDRPRIARHVVQRAALHQCVDARFAEQDERGPIVIAARITGDLPALSEQLADGQRRLVGGHTGRCEHRCKENA